VTRHYLDKPIAKGQRFESACADLVLKAVTETAGGVLVFLPGEGEIRRVAALIKDRLPKDCDVRPLYGAMPFAQQRAAIAPVASGRKVVLATSIAETSLTIEDIYAVVDAGRSRRARFDPGSGMSRLVTERVSKAEATQRAGRAGRVAAGDAYMLWTKGEEGAFAAFPPAEIEAADLAPLALDLAQWGSDELAFLTPPPENALAEARSLHFAWQGDGSASAASEVGAHVALRRSSGGAIGCVVERARSGGWTTGGHCAQLETDNRKRAADQVRNSAPCEGVGRRACTFRRRAACACLP